MSTINHSKESLHQILSHFIKQGRHLSTIAEVYSMHVHELATYASSVSPLFGSLTKNVKHHQLVSLQCMGVHCNQSNHSMG